MRLATYHGREHAAKEAYDALLTQDPAKGIQRAGVVRRKKRDSGEQGLRRTMPTRCLCLESCLDGIKRVPDKHARHSAGSPGEELDQAGRKAHLGSPQAAPSQPIRTEHSRSPDRDNVLKATMYKDDPVERLIDIGSEEERQQDGAGTQAPRYGTESATDSEKRAELDNTPKERASWQWRRVLGLPTCYWIWIMVLLMYFKPSIADALRSANESTRLNFQHLIANTAKPQGSAAGREADHLQCRLANATAGPPPHFGKRTQNDRFVHGTKPTLIHNATLWTGEDILHGVDIQMESGLVTFIEKTEPVHASKHGFDIVDAHGRWVTPGIIDMHTHVGVMGMPYKSSTDDGNSRQGATRPMVRSLDGMNEHDQDMHTAVGGGITTTLVLPGSLNNIGGQAYPVKLGKLHGRPPSSRVLDPPRSLILPGERENGRDALYSKASGMHRGDTTTSFRHIKMACGENARKYGLVRLDEAWNFRREFERAQKLLRRQDDFCAALEHGDAPAEPSFPSELELDSLVDVLRGRTKVHTHCYTMNDLDAMVRHSTEFSFPIAAFHHAHETYMVPELLHKAYDHPPAVAMFSTNANYKYESYFGTPFAGALLRAANITPIYKSDHPVLDTRRLVHQAAEAHHFGLDEIDALKSVTSAPAHVLGLSHRVGHVRSGADADIVLWDRHPLQLGATPVQVFIDGEAQLDHPHASGDDVTHTKPQSAPRQPDYSTEIQRVHKAEPAVADARALAFPTPSEYVESAVLFNVKSFYHRRNNGSSTRIVAEHFDNASGVLVYHGGSLVCVGTADCLALAPHKAQRVNTHGGTIVPGLISYGGTLGLADIPAEDSAKAGQDPSAVNEYAELQKRIIPRAVDALTWGGHDMLRAHASGVTTAICGPDVKGPVGGILTQFDTNVRTILDPFSVRATEVALHIAFDRSGPSLGALMGMLRQVLEDPSTREWKRVVAGELPLVVNADSQEVIAQLILLRKSFPKVRLVVDSLGPLHMLAEHLAANDIGVLMPNKVWLYEWDSLDRLRGPPFTPDTELRVLLKHGVKVGIRIAESWEAAHLLWETAWAAQEAHVTDPATILELITTKYVVVLTQSGIAPGSARCAWRRLCRVRRTCPPPLTQSNPFTYGAKVLAVGTPRSLELFS